MYFGVLLCFFIFFFLVFFCFFHFFIFFVFCFLPLSIYFLLLPSPSLPPSFSFFSPLPISPFFLFSLFLSFFFFLFIYFPFPLSASTISPLNPKTYLEEKGTPFEDNKLYCSVMGILLWLGHCTRPDILFQTIALSVPN